MNQNDAATPTISRINKVPAIQPIAVDSTRRVAAMAGTTGSAFISVQSVLRPHGEGGQGRAGPSPGTAGATVPRGPPPSGRSWPELEGGGGFSPGIPLPSRPETPR